MIEIKKISDEILRGVAGATEDEVVFAALSSEEMTGYCKFKLDGERVLLLDLYEKDSDMLLADGIVRAAVSSCRKAAKTVVCSEQGLLSQYCEISSVYQNKEAPLEDVLRGKCTK